LLDAEKRSLEFSMFSRFQDYMQWVRPRLDEAFKRHLTLLLEDIPLPHAASLGASWEGGKKIRGGLLCLLNSALGGVLEPAIPRANAMELIQSASLIHDDFVDQDTVRRNRPATWTLVGARRAVLLGDVMFASAIKMMSDLSQEDGSVVSDAIAQVSRGAIHEPLDPLLLIGAIESNRLDGRLYEKIIHLKTGILFGAACRLGAIASRAGGNLRERSYRYGLRIGEAYQIADDMQELKRHLVSRSIDPQQMVLLAPTFLYFVSEMRPHIAAVLKGRRRDVSDVLLEYFRVAIERMQDEIERRLQSAAAELAKDFPENEFSELIRRAPWDLIGMFNES
jgi:geranylgeranyl pyrophosphate synthase